MMITLKKGTLLFLDNGITFFHKSIALRDLLEHLK